MCLRCFLCSLLMSGLLVLMLVARLAVTGCWVPWQSATGVGWSGCSRGEWSLELRVVLLIVAMW